jgi:hypothetical protein
VRLSIPEYEPIHMIPRGRRGRRVSGSRIEQWVDELILLSDMIGADRRRAGRHPVVLSGDIHHVCSYAGRL